MPKLTNTNAYSNEDMPAKAAARTEQAQQNILADLVAKTPAPEWATKAGMEPTLYMGGVGYKDPKTGYQYDSQGKVTFEPYVYKPGPNLFGIMGGLALSFLLPGVSSALSNFFVTEGIVTSQVAADLLANTIVNTTANIAQGQSPEDALKNSFINTVVNTGSVEAAKEINKYITDKRVVDALVSAGGSAVKTAAAGGTEQDVARNMTAALAGSAASSAYQSAGDDYTRQTGRLIGSTVAGYITGGGTGAVSNLLGELGSQSKGKVAGTIEDTFRGTTDTGALPASQVAAMTPETDAGAATGELAPVTVTGQTTSDVTGTNIISPNAVTSTPTPTPSPPVVEQPPAPSPVAETILPPQDKAILDLIASPATPSVEPTPTPPLEPVTVAGTKTADITDTDIINAISQEATPSPVAPVIEPAPEVPPVVAPPAAALEPVTIEKQRPADITDTDIINTIAKETTPAAVASVIEPPLETAPVTAPPAAALEPVTVAGQKTTDITDTDIINTIAAETKPVGELQRVEIREKALPTDITKTDIIEEPAKLQDVTVTGKREELPSLAPVTITGKREEPLALEPVTITGKREEPQSLAPVTITGKKDGELEPVTITGKRDGELDPVTITGKTEEPAATPEKEPAPKDKPYKPDLFILGGKQPKAPTKPSDSVLSQALGTTTGLTASRGAGEIEDPSTGKKKRKVWNEETLRLKDALGV